VSRSHQKTLLAGSNLANFWKHILKRSSVQITTGTYIKYHLGLKRPLSLSLSLSLSRLQQQLFFRFSLEITERQYNSVFRYYYYSSTSFFVQPKMLFCTKAQWIFHTTQNADHESPTAYLDPFLSNKKHQEFCG
jgi:hypothetical protein